MAKKWYPCELHCHTLHSDGSFSVRELLRVAQERELSGICITDHNTMSGYRQALECGGIPVVKGIEWTTYYGHMLVLGVDSFVDWRDARPDNIDEKIKQVREKNGIVGIAHPFQLGTPICTGGHWDFRVHNWSNVTYMEIFSEGAPFLNMPNKKARELWHRLLSEGYRITPTMGRDWHRPTGNKLPSGCTWLLIDGEITAEKMRQAIIKGRTVVSAGPLFYVEAEASATIGDTVEPGEKTFRVITDLERHYRVEPERCIKPERIVICSGEGERELPFDQEISFIAQKESWYSFELWGSTQGEENMLLALTAPIYTK